LKATDFVAALTESCRDGAVEGLTKQLEKPAGRKPSQQLRKLSSWFKSLSPNDQQNLTAVMRMAADATLFGVFCVFDGVRTVESTSMKSSFRITATKGVVRTVVSPSTEFLHDIYRARADD
jgi:hypothetical protein